MLVIVYKKFIVDEIAYSEILGSRTILLLLFIFKYNYNITDDFIHILDKLQFQLLN